MATYGRYGILYGYFLKACKRYVYNIVHEKLNVPKESGKMCRYLVEEISYIYNCPYNDVIKMEKYPWYIEESFLNEDKFEKHLDVAMYFKIIKLFQQNVPGYLKKQRNYFCHIPLAALQRGMNRSTFKEKLHIMKQDLEELGIDKCFLTEIEEQIKSILNPIDTQ